MRSIRVSAPFSAASTIPLLLVATILIGASIAHAALADTEVVATGGPTLPPGASDRVPAQLEEITVTATRRKEKVQDVPLSVTVVEGSALEHTNASGIEDYAALVPGISLNAHAQGDDKVTLRGISTQSTLEEANPTTAIYLDDTPITDAGYLGFQSAPSPELLDIDRIEILRGPQGTLFGASAMGGAIRVITAAPDPAAQSGFFGARAIWTAHGGPGYDLRAAENIPLAENNAALRLAGFYRNQSGFVDDILRHKENVNNERAYGGRVSALFSPSDRIHVGARFAYQDRSSRGNNLSEFDEPPLTQTRATAEPHSDRWGVASVTLDYEGQGWKLNASTSRYQRTLNSDFDATDFLNDLLSLPGVLTFTFDERSREFDQELRVESDGEWRMNWLFGAFYQKHDFVLDLDGPAPGLRLASQGAIDVFGIGENLIHFLTRQERDQIAFYGDLVFKASDRLDLNVGARRYRFNETFRNQSMGLLVGAAGTMGVDARGHGAESGLAPKIGARYRVDEHNSAYVVVADGFRPGGVNSTVGDSIPGCLEALGRIGYTATPSQFQSDSLRSYEIGDKGSWLDHGLVLNVALFHVDWRDLQTTKRLSCGFPFVANAGRARSDGLELEAALRYSDRIDIRLTGSYVDARLAKDAPIYDARAGDRVPGVPRSTISVGGRYRFGDSSKGERSLQLEYSAHDASYTDFNRFARQRIPGFGVLNATLLWSSGRTETSLSLHNALDRRGITAINTQAPFVNWRAYTVPRTALLAVRISF